MRRALLLALLPAPALAWHDTDPVTAYTAATLHVNELHVGPFRVGAGLADTFELTTVPLAWLLKTPNLQAKWNFYGDPRADGPSLAARLGLFTLKPHDFDDDIDEDLRFNLIPLAATATWAAGDWRFNLTAAYTHVGTNAEDLDVDDVEVGGVAALSTATLAPAVEWRLGRVLALVLEGRVMVYQQTLAESSQTFEYNGGRTKLELFESGEAEIASAPLGNAVLSAFWSWEVFHLRAGLGYGHYNLPLVDVFIPEPVVFPELDFYWRW